LVDASARRPAVSEAPLEPLVELGHAFAEEVYPDLLRRDVNRVPFWLPWLSRRVQPPRRRISSGRALLYFLATVLPSGLLLFVQNLLWRAYDRTVLVFGLPVSLLLAALIFFWPRGAKAKRWRKRLAALLAVRYKLGPGGLALLLENDDHMASYLQRFLADHHVPYALPLYDEHGRYRFLSVEKVDVLATALLRSVGREHDNELFVLLADLLEVGDRLEPLLRAVRVARARHHQVVVVCPWPPGLPPAPEETDGRGEIRRVGFGKDVRAIMERAAVARFHRAYHKLRRTFARMGVPVVSARSDEPVPLILERMERLRMLGIRR
jgi:hypothetical protein